MFCAVVRYRQDRPETVAAAALDNGAALGKDIGLLHPEVRHLSLALLRIPGPLDQTRRARPEARRATGARAGGDDVAGRLPALPRLRCPTRATLGRISLRRHRAGVPDVR